MSNRMIRDNLVERIWEGTVRNLKASSLDLPLIKT